MFGRKKRRQEPISAVAPEPLGEGAWRAPTEVDRARADGEGANERVVEPPEVSRETGAHAGYPVAGGTGGSFGVTAGQAGKVEQDSPVGDEVAAEAGAPSAHVAGGLSVGADTGADDTVVRDGGVRAGGVHSAGGDTSGGGTAGEDTAATVDGTAGTTSSWMAPDSLALHVLDGADTTIGAFSSAPRPLAVSSAPSAEAAPVSRETSGEADGLRDAGAKDAGDDDKTAPAADRTPAVAASGNGVGSATHTRASTQQDPTGENEDVPNQPVQVAGSGHDDEARRAALVDSLPDADEDTPLMAQIQADATRRIQLRGRRFPRPAQTRIITVANQKGGVGKTTTTVNLAAALAQSGLNVLVLDNDPQGNASTALGVAHHAGTPSIYEVLVDEAPMAGAVQECPDVPNLWCVPATIDLSGAEIELVSMVARETRLRTALDAYLAERIAAGQAPIDYVFVDCPPSLGLLTVNAFVVGREVLIPIQCEYYALEGLTQLLKTIQLIQAHLNPGLHVSTILLTMYDSRTNLAQQVAQEVRDHFPDTTLRTSVPRSVRISEAPSYGQTVITYDAGSSGALAYLEAARELAERGAADGASADSGVGVVGRQTVSPGSASGGTGTNHTNGMPDGASSVVGSSAGTHQEEQ